MRAAAKLFIIGWMLLLIANALAAAERKTPATPEVPDIVALTERAKKSVVIVTHYGRDGKQDGVGAGFIVEKDGLIATCMHVIGEARPITGAS